MAVTMIAATMPVVASGTSAISTVWREFAPMARQASDTPGSSSRNTFSTKRAKNGAAISTRGGTAPSTPSEVPAHKRVNGLMTISKRRNATDRTTLTKKQKQKYERSATRE